jgi:hypothetical protein
MGLLYRASEKTGSSIDEIGEALTDRAFHDFACILYELPLSAGEEEKNALFKTLTVMIHRIGTVVYLSSGQSLVLLPASIDRELVAHRLSKNLNIMPVLSFDSDNPENAIGRINSRL